MEVAAPSFSSSSSSHLSPLSPTPLHLHSPHSPCCSPPHTPSRSFHLPLPPLPHSAATAKHTCVKDPNASSSSPAVCNHCARSKEEAARPSILPPPSPPCIQRRGCHSWLFSSASLRQPRASFGLLRRRHMMASSKSSSCECAEGRAMENRKEGGRGERGEYTEGL